MLDGFLGRAMHWCVLALRLLDHFTNDRLSSNNCICLREFLSARTILLDPHQPQTLFQHTNPQLPCCRLLLSCTMSSRSAGAEGMEAMQQLAVIAVMVLLSGQLLGQQTPDTAPAASKNPWEYNLTVDGYIIPRRSTIFLDELIAFLISMPMAVHRGS